MRTKNEVRTKFGEVERMYRSEMGTSREKYLQGWWQALVYVMEDQRAPVDVMQDEWKLRGQVPSTPLSRVQGDIDDAVRGLKLLAPVDRDQWVAYLLESIEADMGLPVLATTVELGQQRISAGGW
jgi:hypothetical protein